MDEAAFNRGPGKNFGFFERRKIRKVLYEDYFPKFEKIATECATAFSKAQEMRPDGCVNPVKECVLQLPRSPCKEFIKLALRIHPNAIVGLVRLPTFICRVLQFTETDPDIRHSGLAFPFRCYGDNLSDWELGWRFKHQCPATLGVVTMNSAANNALKEFYEDALEQIASNAFASVGATTLEIFGQHDASRPAEVAAPTRFQELMRDAELCDIQWLKNRYIEDTRGNEAGEALRRLDRVSKDFFEQCQDAVRIFNSEPEGLVRLCQEFGLTVSSWEDVREQLSGYAEFLAQFDIEQFKQRHQDFLDCLSAFFFEVEQYHQTGKETLRLWHSSPNVPADSEVFSQNAQKINMTFELLYGVWDLRRFMADPPIRLADEIQSRLNAAHSTIDMTHDLTALTEGDETYGQLAQQAEAKLELFARNLEQGFHPDINYAKVFQEIPVLLGALAGLEQLRFMPEDLTDLLDPTWEMPQSRQVLLFREKMKNFSFNLN